jgi:dTDP-4-amino-4,6-dideoxygalactose transaminase
VGCFSFYPSKNLGAYGEAGAVVTNDRETAETIVRLRDHGETRKYYHARFGQNYRMDNLQGAVLGAKLPFLGKWTEARRKNAEIYTKFLAGLDGVITPRVMGYSNHVFHLYVLKVPRRDELKKFLEEKGIGTGIHYPGPIHLQDACRGLGYRRGDLPLTEGTADSILSLPMYPELTKEQIRYVADSIREFYC